jgi:hypothetical protein
VVERVSKHELTPDEKIVIEGYLIKENLTVDSQLPEHLQVLPAP